MLDLLESFLRKEGYGYCRLDGSTPRKERQDTIERFKKNAKLIVFLISTKAGVRHSIISFHLLMSLIGIGSQSYGSQHCCSL